MLRVAADGVALAVHEWPGNAGRGGRRLHPRADGQPSAAGRRWPRPCAQGYRSDRLRPPRPGRQRQAGDGLQPRRPRPRSRGAARPPRAPKVVLMGHSLGAPIALRFAVDHPSRVRQLVLIDGGLDVRAEVLDSLGPAIDRLGTSSPRSTPSSSGCGRFRCSRDGGTTTSSATSATTSRRCPAAPCVPRHRPRPSRRSSRNLQRERLWTLHHRVRCPTLILRAPDGLLTATDCLMTHEEARADGRGDPEGEARRDRREPTTTRYSWADTAAYARPCAPFSGASSPAGEATATADPSLLRTESLTIRFGGHVVVDHVSPRGGRGTLKSIIGPNGAGKTTFFNLLSGQYRPSEGRIVFKGRDITDVERRRPHATRDRALLPADKRLPHPLRPRERPARRPGPPGARASSPGGTTGASPNSRTVPTRSWPTVLLESKWAAPASALAHGEKRKLELGHPARPRARRSSSWTSPRPACRSRRSRRSSH